MQRTGCAAASLGLALACWAAPAGAAQLDALLEVAGASRQLEAWPEVSLGAREQAQRRLAPDAWAWLLRELDVQFAAPTLLARVSGASELEGVDAAALLRGYRDSGSAGVLGPAQGFPVADLREFPDFASRVSGGELAPARLALIARLDAATGFARNAWRVSSAVSRAIAVGARVLACEGGAAVGDPPPDEVERLRALVTPFRERVQLELLFANRARTPAELARALRFLETDEATGFHGQLALALETLLEASMQELAQRLVAEAQVRCR